MKKLILLFALACNPLFSQITLEATFPGKYNYYTDSNSKFYLSKGMLHKIYIYKQDEGDYTLYKSFTPSIPSGSYIQILDKSKFNLTKNIFNADDKLEIICFIRTNITANLTRLVIYNEDGEIVKDFGSGYRTLNNYALEEDDLIDVFLDETNNRMKLKVYKTDETEIYDLGNNILGIDELNQILNINAYPNPTSNKLFISNPNNGNTKIDIYDISGKLIMTKSFNANEEVAEIDVKMLPIGTYIYKVGNKSAKFIKK